uniref:Uncharacterized protein n=1 Tax=Cacopsylla melanoneura TaxID=428564 RepID=A0A8D8QN53_9HEMI
MMTLVFKLLLAVVAIVLLVSRCESVFTIQLGPDIWNTTDDPPGDLCRNGSTSCPKFNLHQAQLVCGETVQNWPQAAGVRYTSITSAKCMNQTCHVEVATDEKSIHGSVNCLSSVTSYNLCQCTNFQV